MADKLFKMLKKEGIGLPYPFTQALMDRKDMKIIYMTKAEIDEEVRVAAMGRLELPGNVVEGSGVEEVQESAAPTKPPRPKVNEKRLARAKELEIANNATSEKAGDSSTKVVDIPLDPEDVTVL
jgi:hypothetical protein